MIAIKCEDHPSSAIENGAVIGENVENRPVSAISGRMSFLQMTFEILSHVAVIGHTSVGKGSKIFPGAVIAATRQSVHHSALNTKLVIGENCTIAKA